MFFQIPLLVIIAMQGRSACYQITLDETLKVSSSSSSFIVKVSLHDRPPVEMHQPGNIYIYIVITPTLQFARNTQIVYCIYCSITAVRVVGIVAAVRDTDRR